ncbi:MAG: N-acetylmuramoyl-L-alanine amidase [Muribaculaceae bacterium]|nr:N-acetylmuramoyl-L-alanine amidase [Muribaculaceae bacterium]
MRAKYTNIIRRILTVITIVAGVGMAMEVKAESNDDFVVVIDPGHGGKDFGAIDNSAKEKEINLAVAQRLAELIRKKMKDTEVIMTRNNDTFISLQGRADIANKSKGDLFISIHTNSVDMKNKNRTTVAGASVYTLGSNKDEANMEIARRENSVIEMESSYQQKYSGFDPNKDESYIIFEMAQKKNLSQSNRFAKMVQDNLVKIAGRKDRGVKQAGFWVLWSTSMPAVLVELDFICNPESAKFLTSREGVEKLAEAIYQAVKVYEQNYRQSIRMSQNKLKNGKDSELRENIEPNTLASASDSKKKRQSSGWVSKDKPDLNEEANYDAISYQERNLTDENIDNPIGIFYRPISEERDKSHVNLDATRNQRKPRSTSDGRRRRSTASRNVSASRIVEGEIALHREFTGESAVESQPDEKNIIISDDSDGTPAKGKNKKKSSKKVSTKKNADSGNVNKSGKKSENNKQGKFIGSKDKYDKKAKQQEERNRAERMKSAQKKAQNEKRDKKEKNQNKSVDKEKESSANQTSAQQDEHGGRRKSLKRKLSY